MTKTIDEQLERLASAQERTATALESILEVIANVTIPVRQPETQGYAGTDNELASEEAAVEVAEEAEVEEQQLQSEPEPEDEQDGEAEAEADDASGDEGDPLGDGEADVDEYPLPAKLTNDTLRGFARDLIAKEGKAAAFEVLAEVGKGYKAVGEVSKEDLKEAHLKMVARLKG